MDRFWNKVAINTPDQCWYWMGASNLNKGGKRYGCFAFNGKNQGSHRVSYQIHKGQIPEGLSVLHSCDNSLCVNPNHLFTGTPQANSKDMVNKGRSLKGESHPNRRYSDKLVIDIRSDYCKGFPRRYLVEKYGIAISAFKSIIRKDTWVHLYGVNGCPSYQEVKKSIVERPKTGSNFTVSQIHRIRKLLSDGVDGQTLAFRFNTTTSVISQIRRGVSYSHV